LELLFYSQKGLYCIFVIILIIFREQSQRHVLSKSQDKISDLKEKFIIKTQIFSNILHKVIISTKRKSKYNQEHKINTGKWLGYTFCIF
jgi:hypothetical protein